MGSGTNSDCIEHRGIYLVNVEFTDNSGTKQRPVVVISNDKFNSSTGDFIACPITKTISGRGIEINNSSLDEGKLDFVSKIKSCYPTAFNKTRAIKKIGKLKIELSRQIVTDIRELISC